MRYIGFMKNNIQPLKRLSLREEVYQTLKHNIVMLEFQPEQKLQDKELAEQFGVSRTPVREALKRLEDEGLVQTTPGSSTKVAPLNLEEAKQSFIVVAALHALAAKLACTSLQEDMGELTTHNQSLEHAIKTRNVLKAIEADEAFHSVFLNRANNLELERVVKQTSAKIQRLEIARFSSLASLASVDQHKEIINACGQKDAALTSQLVETNWLTLGEALTSEEESK
ncbi:GntR family transcriptional regulator [Priestia megaterium]|uniref:GntR family transcriptional regulator n=1 Tax=Priestia megaterium TaxID=1404 RepID=UPI0011A0E3D3|nr:GntR family transcriptional regulator [Priestia megaterium]